MIGTAIHPLLAGPVTILVLLGGAYLTATLVGLRTPNLGGRLALRLPAARAAVWLQQSVTTTERPDGVLWWFAPAGYLGCAALALSVIPFGRDAAIADVGTGIVVFGVGEVLAIVCVHLQGWSPNSLLPLIATSRYLAVMLSYELISMFVLIAAALPAESLSIGQIVASQAEVWNVVRQPLGLPLFAIVALGISTWGPFELAIGADTAGGVLAEASGRNRLVWEVGRHALLFVFAAMAAAVFLGGWHGPLLPGWLWMALKTMTVLWGLVWLGDRLPRWSAERLVLVTWTVLLPLSFADLAIAGIVALP
ncbi:MAG: complex I subunit 1 family protein [Euzebya sp.]